MRPSDPIPLQVILTVLQFAVPENLMPGEARVLCKGAASALTSPPFWRGMTVDLDRDEGDEKPCQQSNARAVRNSINYYVMDNLSTRDPPFGAGDVANALAAAETTNAKDESKSPVVVGARNTLEPLLGKSADLANRAVPLDGARFPGGSGSAAVSRSRKDAYALHAEHDQYGRSSTTEERRRRAPIIAEREGHGGKGAKRRVNRAEASGEWKSEAAPAERGRGVGKQFLRRYHHHLAFRRLAPPIMETETVEMPVPLYPTCIHACGSMVAMGTREGPVLLFDSGPLPNNAARKAAKVYGSLSAGEGPITSVLLDRVKVVAAGRASHKGGGGFVIRIYAVDSTRLLRTLRCLENTAQMSLVDPVLVVLATPSGRLCFRDLYAKEGGTGLGQHNALVSGVTSFAAVEPSSVRYPGGPEGVTSDDDIGDTVFHCANANGKVFEVTNSGNVRNIEAVDDAVSSSVAVRTRWHVCADMEALVMIRATPWGSIAGWRLLPTGRRCRGAIFSFAVGRSISSTVRMFASVRLAGGGLFLATAGEGTVPCLWDVRLARRPPTAKFVQARNITNNLSVASFIGQRSSSSSSLSPPDGTLAQLLYPAAEHHAAVGVGLTQQTEGREGIRKNLAAKGRKTQALGKWGLASIESTELELRIEGKGTSTSTGQGDRFVVTSQVASLQHQAAVGAGARVAQSSGRRRPRRVEVNGWPTGVWAVAAAVDAVSGRLVCACSDGRMRITKLRPNVEEQRLRAAVLRGRKATAAP